MVHGHQENAVPGALLHGDFRPQSFDDFVALLGRQATELDVRPLALEGRHACRGVTDEQGAVAIQIGLALAPSSWDCASRPDGSHAHARQT